MNQSCICGIPKQGSGHNSCHNVCSIEFTKTIQTILISNSSQISKRWCCAWLDIMCIYNVQLTLDVPRESHKPCMDGFLLQGFGTAFLPSSRGWGGWCGWGWGWGGWYDSSGNSSHRLAVIIVRFFWWSWRGRWCRWCRWYSWCRRTCRTSDLILCVGPSKIFLLNMQSCLLPRNAVGFFHRLKLRRTW